MGFTDGDAILTELLLTPDAPPDGFAVGVDSLIFDEGISVFSLAAFPPAENMNCGPFSGVILSPILSSTSPPATPNAYKPSLPFAPISIWSGSPSPTLGSISTPALGGHFKAISYDPLPSDLPSTSNERIPF